MKKTIKVNEILQVYPGTIKAPEQVSEQLVQGVEYDSREVEKNSVFVAISGEFFDGHSFIPKAIEGGACLVFGTQEKWLKEYPDTYVQVDDARKALAYLSAAFYGYPAKQLKIIGVTGTDGKTTTTNLIFSILKQAGIKAGMISTVNAVIGDESIDTGFHVTTPEAPMVQELLARMVAHGLTHVVLETTSHGLDQSRVAACEYDIGVITNVTHEHLDYHKDYLNYLKTKAILLTMLAETEPKPEEIRLAVVNKDDRSYSHLLDVLSPEEYKTINVVTYSRENDADVRVIKEEFLPSGLELEIEYQDKTVTVSSHLVGAYNTSNILAAVTATAVGLGIDLETITKGIQALPGIPGRMERIDCGQDFTAIVDFAHTPNAISVALDTANQLAEKRVIAVFGSAGLRDREKRKMMAAESVKKVDFSIFTAEDPRTEKLEDILGEMKGSAAQNGAEEGQDYIAVPDRGQAIRRAVQMAEPGDLIIVCGKGHEQSMCFGTTEYPWDDRIAMRAALADHLQIDGPDMPYLPTQD